MDFYKCPKCQKNSVQEYLDSFITGTVHCSKLNRKVIVRRIKRGWHCLLPNCGYDKSVISLVDLHGHKVA